MNKSPIFAIEIIVNNSLYSMKYDENEQDEFQRIFNEWNDIEFLESFFEENKNDLFSGFYENISITDAIFRTIEESERLEKSIKKIAEKGKQDNCENLQTLFKPLNNKDEYPVPLLQKNKTYGSNNKSWLRIYAIRLEPNLFVVTGGAIKLTKTMNEREHLIKELEKIEQVKKYFVAKQVFDNDSLIEVFKYEL